MSNTKIVGRTKLTRYRDGWSADHPFGAEAYFYQIKSKAEDGKVTEPWVWSYNGADSMTFDELEDCVDNWRETAGLF